MALTNHVAVAPVTEYDEGASEANTKGPIVMIRDSGNQFSPWQTGSGDAYPGVEIESVVEITPSIPSVTNVTGRTVSNSATRLDGSANPRMAIVIENQGDGDLYVGTTDSVTTQGATMGIRIVPGGSISFGYEIGVTALWGIYSEAAASQNVSVLESGTFPA